MSVHEFQRLSRPSGSNLVVTVGVQNGRRRRVIRAFRHGQSVIHESRPIVAIDGPPDDAARIHVERDAAEVGPFSPLMFSDVSQPQRVGLRRYEVALDEVLFGRDVDQISMPLLRAGRANEALLVHDSPD